MKTQKKRSRKLARQRNKDRVNRERKQQMIFSPVFAPVFILVMIKLALEKDSTPEKVLARLRKHILKLTGNAFFPATDLTVAELQTMADELEEAIDAVEAGDHGLIPHRDGLVADSREMIRQLSYHIQYLSKGDEEKILSSGYEVRKVPGAKPDPEQVQHLSSKALGGGRVKLTWDKEPGSLLYIIEKTQNLVANTWVLVKKVKTKTYTVENLVAGQVNHFRVYGTNGPKDGPPSDSVEQRTL